MELRISHTVLPDNRQDINTWFEQNHSVSWVRFLEAVKAMRAQQKVRKPNMSTAERKVDAMINKLCS